MSKSTRAIRRPAVLGLVLSALASLFLAQPTQAAPAAVAPSYGSIYRDTTADQVIIAAGESVTIRNYGNIESTYFDSNPISGSTTFTYTPVAVPATSGITQSSENWHISTSGSSCSMTSSTSASITVSASCVSSMNLSHGITLTNTSGTDITVTLDTSVADIKRAGTSIASATGVNASMSVSAYRNISSSTFSATANDTRIYAGFEACLSTSSGLVAGDVLTVSFEATLNGSPVAVNNGWGVSVADGEWDINDYDADHDYTTYTVPAGFTSITSVSLDATMNAPDPGTYLLSMSVKNSSGTLVAGSCSNGGGGMGTLTYPATISAHNSSSTFLPFSQSTKAITAGLTSLTTATSGDDGSGGKLYAAVTSGSAKVIQITPTGVNSKFAKVGKATIASVTSIGRVGVYNAKKNWFATSGNPMVGYKIHTGSMTTSSTVTTKSVTSANLNKACGGTGYSSNGFYGVSAALSMPLVNVMCTKTSNQGSFTVLATITPTTGAVNKVLAVGNPGSGANALCLNDSFGYNLGATGTVNAVIVYLATATSSDNCSTMTYTKREIFSITAAGKVSTKTITGNPWGSTAADEPSYLFFAPGKTAGTWIGTGYLVSGPMSPPSGVRLFSVSAANALSPKGTIDYEAASLADYSYPSFYPVKEISSSKWTLKMTVQPGAGTMQTGLTTVNPTSAAVTVGEVLEVDGYGSYMFNPIINSTSWSSDGKLRHYVISDATHVVISSWSSPAS